MADHDHLAKFVRADPHEPDVVPPSQPERGQRQQRHGKAQPEVRHGDVITEAKLRRRGHTDHGIAEVGQCCPTQMIPSPR